MHIMRSRRDFFATLSAAGAATALNSGTFPRRRGAAGDDRDPAGPRSRHRVRAGGRRPHGGVDVKADFAALGDSSSNDATAIQNALNSARPSSISHPARM